jgi:hypothetical protein
MEVIEMKATEFIIKKQNKLNNVTLKLLTQNLKLVKYDLHSQGLNRLTLVGDKGTYSLTTYKYPNYQVILDYWDHNSDLNYLIVNQSLGKIDDVFQFIEKLTTLIKGELNVYNLS